MAPSTWQKLLLPLAACALLPAAVVASGRGWDMDQEPLAGSFDDDACPDYAQYAAYPQ